MKIIIGGGGTGGHVFPAIAIAQAIKKAAPDTDILFVGAQDKIEMEKVPAAGFKIIGLPAAGLQRKLTLKNLVLPFKLLKCARMSKKIIKDFCPDIAIGVGGYASGPILRAASKAGVPIMLQEQNSHAGLTNKMLADKAVKIFTAYKNMDKYFDPAKTMLTGNPVRADIAENSATREEAIEHFSLDPNKKTILIIGGSLGAGTINKSMLKFAEKFQAEGNIQIIWQTGKYYWDNIEAEMKTKNCPDIHPTAFVKRMDLAYKAADIVISRSGALSVSELCLTAKPVIFIPSPNVAEDHQTKNAMALVNENAAGIIKDSEAEDIFFEKIQNFCNDSETMHTYSKNIYKLAVKNSADIIAAEIINFVNNKSKQQ